MPTIQVKHVPEQTHEVLRARAKKAGKSLQEYLLGQLVEQTSQPTLAELFDEIEARDDNAHISADEIVAAIHAGRAGR